jgi:hypothetical protein
MNYTPCTPFPYLPEQLAALAELALDLRWSWSHATDILWQRIDSDLWALTRNPWLLLQNASGDSLQALAADRDFVANLLVWTVTIASLLFLALLGGIGAYAGGVVVWRETLRVTFWGALAMALTAGIGALVGTAV